MCRLKIISRYRYDCLCADLHAARLETAGLLDERRQLLCEIRQLKRQLYDERAARKKA
jgi:hypothetical protein